MHRITCTVFFEDPFWVGVCERYIGGAYSCAKVTFGAEPSEAEVWAFVLERFGSLAFSEPVSGTQKPQTAANPKRMQRQAARAVAAEGIGTKAQQALKSQYEAGKQEHKALSRAERLAEDQRRFLQRQDKKKAKHRGH